MKNFTNISKFAAFAAIAAIGFSLNACEEKEKASEPTDVSYYKDRVVIFWDLSFKEMEELQSRYSEDDNAAVDDDAYYRSAAWLHLEKIGEKVTTDTAQTLGFIIQRDTIFLKKGKDNDNENVIILFDGKAKPIRTSAIDIHNHWFFDKDSSKKE
jgi:hypothetical protein